LKILRKKSLSNWTGVYAKNTPCEVQRKKDLGIESMDEIL
jgi:hypothetical protein